MDWRITTSEKDYTESVAVDSPIIGATVIKSPKGCKDFHFFSKGQTQKVLDVFGYPTKDYPSIQDALDVVATSSLWIASPYKNGKFSGAYVTPNGTVPFIQGTDTATITDYSEISCEVPVAIGNGIISTFTKTLDNAEFYVKESITLNIGGVDVTPTITTSGEIETLADDLLASGSQLDTSTGVLTLVFNLAPTENINAKYNTNMSNTYFTLFSKDQQEGNDLQVKVEKDEDIKNAFNISVFRYNPVAEEYIELGSSPYLVGLNENSKDDYGQNIYIENVFGENNMLFNVEVVNSVVDTFIDDIESVSLTGGNRGDIIEGSDIATTYDFLQDNKKYNLSFVFDPTVSTECITKFDTLRKNYQKFTRFLYATPNVSASTIIADPLTYNGAITNNRGIYLYCLSWGIRTDVYQGSNFLCSNLGLITQKLVQVLENGYGQPAGIDGDGYGGILASGITKLSQSVTDSELEQLDKLNFNPVVVDVTYGYRIDGAKTRNMKKNAYASIGVSSLADTLLSLITSEVLPPRLHKLIDETSYSNVRSGCNSILSTYSTPLEDYLVICDNTNNTPETKAKETLVVQVSVIYKSYANKIHLVLSSSKSGTDLEEFVEKI